MNQVQTSSQITSQYIAGGFVTRGFQYAVEPSFERLEKKGYVTTGDLAGLFRTTPVTARKILKSNSLGYDIPGSNHTRLTLETFRDLIGELGIDGTEEGFLTTGEVADILKLAPRTVANLYDSGRITGFRVPAVKQERRISRRSLAEFMQITGIEKGEEYFTTGEVAEILNRVPRTIAKLLDNGKLRGYKIPTTDTEDGAFRRISRTSLINEMRATGYYNFCLEHRREVLQKFGLLETINESSKAA